MTRLKILMSAYACEPNRGSEPGVGWNWVAQMSRHHDVWVITRRNNRTVIQAELAKAARSHACLQNARFIYYDLPRWARFWKSGHRGVYLYYYLWQLGAYLQARRLQSDVGFDVVHHVTFVMYWMPSLLALLPVPFIWGPVGGGESTPARFLSALGRKGRFQEMLRASVQALARMDPLVRLTARRCALAFATTADTERRLKQIGCHRTQVCAVMGLDASELNELNGLEAPESTAFRVATVGNLIAWKGVEFGLRAFAGIQEEYPGAEYWLIGDGPEQQPLRDLAAQLGVADRVRFLGRLPRALALSQLAACDVLLLPSLHDSGSCACTEAMALGKPVICVDLGGPALQVTAETGFKIPARSPSQVVASMSDALGTLAGDPQLRRQMGAKARERVHKTLNWDAKGLQFSEIYRELSFRSASSLHIPVPMKVCGE